ncbi:MAG: DUF445 domain-containing protein [Acidimicrobiia bacterium]|nr:DUF445 domain-containing protein [Acidimicrobiia bacterium]NNL12944.1 DUF445 domain-containing protein [Acidimicrobiia bacterium]NNL69853.1 DUF445 domain-containing protein [Acidimicrobiia bacterium]
MSSPEFAGSWDEERSAQLKKSRRRATGLLVIVVLIFIATHLFTDGRGFWGFVQAASEAGVVGGIADWFAVTALFRHPLGIPIPHTAVIPRGKDAFGRGLGEFVAQNFLDAELLTNRLKEIDPADRLALWLMRPQNSDMVARRAAGVLVGLTDALDDDEVQAAIRSTIDERIRRVELAPLLGTVAKLAMEGGHHHALVDAALLGLSRTIEENQELFRGQLRRESPWWVPEPIDEVVFQKVYDGAQRFITDVTSDRDHPLRAHLDERATNLITQLSESPEILARGEELKAAFLDHPEFAAWTDELWTDLKRYIALAAAQPESDLRRRLAKWTTLAGERLATDPALRERVNRGVISVVRQGVEQSGEEVTALIASTVERWDAQETSRRLELLLGRDLQFIRINGTMVGALVGIVIHTIVVL